MAKGQLQLGPLLGLGFWKGGEVRSKRGEAKKEKGENDATDLSGPE